VICSSGVGFDPMLDGERLTFGFEGIWQGTAVLYDRQTKSLWMHFTGECFSGKHTGRRLKELDTGRHTTWAAWRRDHPTTDVMAQDERFSAHYFARSQARSGAAGFPPTFPATIQSRDPRLELADLLLGVRVAGSERAYPYERLARGPGVVEDTVGDVPLTIWFDTVQRSAAAFDARLDGKTLHFTRLADGVTTRFRDRQTGSIWDLEGLAVTGAHAGKRLGRPPQLLSEWYGWFAHHPDTTVWGR
jgi:hypothetical protein